MDQKCKLDDVRVKEEKKKREKEREKSIEDVVLVVVPFPFLKAPMGFLTHNNKKQQHGKKNYEWEKEGVHTTTTMLPVATGWIQLKHKGQKNPENPSMRLTGANPINHVKVVVFNFCNDFSTDL